VNDVAAALVAEHAALERLLAQLSEADWTQPTRCEGWTVADVVLHLAQTDEMASPARPATSRRPWPA
jgi:uncharacterized protein (TIGR03083 family)